ncbi:MAG TPA: RNA 2',3'-cyclic phosphodiesterase [Acidobacteriaceae bacterium]|jgi:2'-5' RNA ligase|nr:RNA 2',3'-cyclic phosphodiesterase [Acidobacteriaceae bacterium]
MRLFLGLALSDEARIELERLTLRLRTPGDGLRWWVPEQWHITLAFLGSVPPEAHASLLRNLECLREPQADLHLDGLGLFDRVGVLFASVHLTPSLVRLHTSVSAAARASGLPIEDRPYRPHITLARRRGRGRPQSFSRWRTVAEQQRLHLRWPAREFLLYESELSRDGSRYHIRGQFPLTDPTQPA